MEKEEIVQEEKVKVKRHNTRKIITKIVALFIAGLMVLATCSTLIFAILANIE